MLINLSNHPSSKWPANQLAAARQYGIVADLPFPAVPPEAGPADIDKLAAAYERKVVDLLQLDGDPQAAVHIMGELTFVYNLVTRLKARQITCLAATTHRQVKEQEGVKTSVFTFVRFRAY